MLTKTPRSRYLAPLAAVCATLALAATASSLSAAEETPDRFEKAYELGGIEKVRLQNVNGPVHIGTWERNYLRVTATNINVELTKRLDAAAAKRSLLAGLVAAN